MAEQGMAAGSNVAAMTARPPHDRLLEIDALRGIAAMAVVLYHYTTRFAELYGPVTAPWFSLAQGHYGVNLFFIISGFVIFMTLERVARPMDFVVSRFSRLFPTYWAAILLTLVLTHALGLPGRLVDMPTALANFIMLHGLFRVPHVDGVYWTLEVELLFYCGMLLLYRLDALRRIHLVLLAMLALRLVYALFEHAFGIDLPWTLYRLLILRYIPWFSLGIAIYLATSRPEARRRAALIAAGAGLALLADSALLLGLALLLAGIVHAAAQGRLSLLRHGLFVWLGSISYPLYLLHENIGWSIQLRALALGLSINTAILLALAFNLALATLVSRKLEQPAMRWLRQRYRARQSRLAA